MAMYLLGFSTTMVAMIIGWAMGKDFKEKKED